jgi:hypothetical protein
MCPSWKARLLQLFSRNLKTRKIGSNFCFPVRSNRLFVADFLWFSRVLALAKRTIGQDISPNRAPALYDDNTIPC